MRVKNYALKPRRAEIDAATHDEIEVIGNLAPAI
jgi:hypothetical protein